MTDISASLHHALRDVNDVPALKALLVSALVQLDQAGSHISAGYLRLKPERQVPQPKPRAGAITLSSEV